MHKGMYKRLIGAGCFGSCERCGALYQDIFGGATQTQNQLYNCATSVPGLWYGIPLTLYGTSVHFWTSGYGSGYDLLGFAIDKAFVSVAPMSQQEPVRYDTLERAILCDLCIKVGLNAGHCKVLYEYALGDLDKKESMYAQFLRIGHEFDARCAQLWQEKNGTDAAKSEKYWHPFLGTSQELSDWGARASSALEGCYEIMKKNMRTQARQSKAHSKQIIKDALAGKVQS